MILKLSESKVCKSSNHPQRMVDDASESLEELMLLNALKYSNDCQIQETLQLNSSSARGSSGFRCLIPNIKRETKIYRHQELKSEGKMYFSSFYKKIVLIQETKIANSSLGVNFSQNKMKNIVEISVFQYKGNFSESVTANRWSQTVVCLFTSL